MKRYAILISILLLLIISSVFINLPPDRKSKVLSSHTSTPTQIAEQFIVSRVGKEYFQENFIVNQITGAYNGSTYIYYTYNPLRDYNLAPLSINVSGGEVTSPAKIVWVPECLEEPSLCEINITTKQVQDIMASHNLTKNNSRFTLFPPFLTSSICPDERLLMINYTTGEVTYSEPRVKCLDPITFTEEDFKNSPVELSFEEDCYIPRITPRDKASARACREVFLSEYLRSPRLLFNISLVIAIGGLLSLSSKRLRNKIIYLAVVAISTIISLFIFYRPISYEFLGFLPLSLVTTAIWLFFSPIRAVTSMFIIGLSATLLFKTKKMKLTKFLYLLLFTFLILNAVQPLLNLPLIAKIPTYILPK